MAKPDPDRIPSAWDRRGLLLALGAAGLLFGILSYAGPSWAVVLYQLAGDGAMLVLWLAAAVGWGAVLVAPFRRFDDTRAHGTLRFVTAAAAGLGAMSLAVLGLGLAGWLGRGVAFALVGCGVAGGGVVAWRRGRGLLRGDVGGPLREWLRGRAGWEWLWLTVVPALAVALVGACVPPGMLWHPDEPHGYDVAEYHLQVPREWYNARQVVPLRHNAFSFFPFNVETHYLLAMHLRGGPWVGMYLAQLMHVAFVVLAVLAVYGVGASVLAPAGRGRAAVGALVAASAPWLTLLAPVGYNEGGILLYGTLSVGWALRGLEIDLTARAAAARFVVAGAMAGFACGVKLTAVPLVLLGVPVAVLVASPRAWRFAAVFVAIGTLTFSPWLLRNIAWAGNPVFPEAASLLGKAHFTDAQVERWERAHSPRPDQRGVGARLLAGGKEVALNWRFGFVALPLAALALRPRNRASVVPGVMLVLLALFWLALTHLQGRFFVLAIPLAGLMVAAAHWGKWFPAVAALVAASALGSWAMVHREFVARLDGAGWVGVLGAENLAGLTPPEAQSVPQDATLVLAGEARAFWYQRPMGLLRYRTVFDVNVPEGMSVVEAWRGDSRTPAEWLLVDADELRRFHRTYHAIPALPPDLQAAKQHVLVPPGAGGG